MKIFVRLSGVEATMNNNRMKTKSENKLKLINQ